jgi:hypothetical protein
MNNKYNKLKIVQEDGMFVGYCLQNDEVIAKTAPCKDSTTASRNLSILLGSMQAPQLPLPQGNGPSVIKSAPPATVPMSYTASRAPQPSGPRKCCGRS